MPTTLELLKEAKAAYHRLQIGEQAVDVRDADGSSVRYTAANASRLEAYIAKLQSEVDGNSARLRRPMRPVWG